MTEQPVLPERLDFDEEQVANVINNFNNVMPTYQPVIMPKKNAAAVFWLDMFFGFLGVHRFYLGHIGLGLVYLFTGGLFMVGAIVDLFIAWKITRKENVRRGYGPVTK